MKDIDLIEQEIACSELSAAQVFTQMLQIADTKDKTIQLLANVLKEAADVLDIWQIAEEYNPSGEYKKLAEKYLNAK